MLLLLLETTTMVAVMVALPSKRQKCQLGSMSPMAEVAGGGSSVGAGSSV